MLDKIPYTLKFSRRKTIGIYVSGENGVEVRAPYHVSAESAHHFVMEKQNWIRKQLQKIAAQPQKHQPDWQWGSQHYFLGELQTIHHREDGEVDYVLPGKAADSEELIQKRVQSWYRQQAMQLIDERHQHWRQQSPFELPDSYTEVRQMKRRWGTCRRNGKIIFNTNLVKYPLPCVDVVIVHELCHLLEFNHSSRFYRLMDQAMPQWQQYDAMLNELSLQY